MSELQTCVKHAGDCSCYKIMVDEYNVTYECHICDCGALRKAMRKMTNSDLPRQSDIFNAWLRHIDAISRI